jgi:predicted metal-dependent hydrolase
MSSDVTLPVRSPDFAYRDDTDPVWTPLYPEFACAANSVSALMPYMEPYFVRSVAAALPRLDDDLAPVARSYLGQEMSHQRHHRHFNRFLVARYPRLETVTGWADRTYRWLERTRSTELNVAFAATSETIAYTAARWAAGHRHLFQQADPQVAALFLWHLAEEVEHKSVAHDVYVAIGGSRRRYLGAMILALVLVTVFVWLGTTLMVVAERRWWHPLTWIRLTVWAVTFAFELLPLLAISLLPGSHPGRLADPTWYEVWLRELDSGTLPRP